MRLFENTVNIAICNMSEDKSSKICHKIFFLVVRGECHCFYVSRHKTLCEFNYNLIPITSRFFFIFSSFIPEVSAIWKGEKRNRQRLSALFNDWMFLRSNEIKVIIVKQINVCLFAPSNRSYDDYISDFVSRLFSTQEKIEINWFCRYFRR